MDRAQRAPERRHRAVVLVGSLDRRIVPALRFAARLAAADVRAVHVSVDPEQTRRLAGDWMDLGLGWLPLHVRDGSSEPFLAAVRRAIETEAIDAGEVTVILPEAQHDSWWHRFLHRRAARRIAGALSGDRRLTILLVPYFGPAKGRQARAPLVRPAPGGVGARP